MDVLTPQLTVLVATPDAKLMTFLESARSAAPSFDFEIWTSFSDLHAQLRRPEVALVVVHVTRNSSSSDVKEVLWAVNHLEHTASTILVMDELDETQKNAYLRAGAAWCLPRDVSLETFAHRLHTLTFRARSAELAHSTAAGQAANQMEELADVLDSSFYVLSPEMMQTMEQIRHVMPQDTTILFTGETGTGKTRTARLMHEMSPRKGEPFLVVDCNALSPSLIESELFGHVRGAFTGADRDRQGKFAAVGKGTIVLDEINSLPLCLQSKLLRVVDERVFEPVGSNKALPMRARLITISNAVLTQEVAAGRFRSDLFYRLNVVGFYMPPLRERGSAIGPLAHKFLARFAANSRVPKSGITQEAQAALETYHWPGNIRELANVIERAATLFPGPVIELSHLPEAMRGRGALQAGPEFSGRAFPGAPNALCLEYKAGAAPECLTLGKTKENAEVLRITQALCKHQNNRLRTARELGISRMALYKKLHKYGICRTG